MLAALVEVDWVTCHVSRKLKYTRHWPCFNAFALPYFFLNEQYGWNTSWKHALASREITPSCSQGATPDPRFGRVVVNVNDALLDTYAYSPSLSLIHSGPREKESST